MRVEVLKGAEPVQVLLSGDIDVSTVSQVTSVLADLAGHDVIVDLSGVEFIDSEGLSSLLIAHRTIAAAGGTLVLRKPTAMTARVLAVAAVDQVIQVVD